VHIKPRKSLGQNFLTDEYYVEKIVDAVRIEPQDFFLEIGPGRGVVTAWLVKRARRVLAVELDARLCALLQERFAESINLEIRQQDFLEFDFNALAEAQVRVMGNIPYHITSPIMFRLFEVATAPDGPRVSDLTILMQREVAQRITAPPCTKAYGVLSVFSRFYSTPEQLLQVPAGAFTPRPKVESTLVRFAFPAEPRYPLVDRRLFQRLVRVSFNQRRKTLRNSLKALPEFKPLLPRLEFDLSLRPEALALEDFIALYHEIEKVRDE